MTYDTTVKTYDIKPSKRELYAETALAVLSNKEPNSVTEDALTKVLHRYNLRDALIALGKLSFYVFSIRDPQVKIGKAVWQESTSQIYVPQFCLAYLANLLLISRTNDHKRAILDKDDNILTLCNIYLNSLVDPTLQDNENSSSGAWLNGFMIRMHTEQMRNYQTHSMYMIARTIVIFREIVPNNVSARTPQLTDILHQEMGLSLDNYLGVAFAVFASAQTHGASFDPRYLYNSDSPELQSVLTRENVENFLKVVAGDYSQFREEDLKRNKDFNPDYTKHRFNPLSIYPVIKTQVGESRYVIPNVTLYLYKVYWGLYWWFDNYFRDKNQEQQEAFRTYFGKIFEEYVGVILKKMFGENAVEKEISYNRGQNRFIDWTVERGNKVYLFEAKAYQFALPTLQTGNEEALKKEIKSKVGYAITKVYKRMQDIERYSELAHFRNKQLVPILVFLDIPLISASLLDEWIKDELKEIELRDGLSGLVGFNIIRLNIEELEFYHVAANTIDLDDAFREVRDTLGEGFISILNKHVTPGQPNPFLGKVYNDFMQEIFHLPGE